MRLSKLKAVLVTFALASCAEPSSMRDLVGYVPPTSLPAQPRRTIVQAPAVQVWNNLVNFLETSAFEIDHTDPDNQLIIARYSGSPAPFIDCGSIVTHQNGRLSEIPGAIEQISLNDMIDDQPVVLNRHLNLDGRIIIRLSRQSLGTVISTDTTYVVTKVVNVETPISDIKEGSRETISFSAGKRAGFSKGTACQPNGALDRTILTNLPNIVGSKEITRADLPVEQRADTTLDRMTADQRDAALVPDRPEPLSIEPRGLARSPSKNDPGHLEAAEKAYPIDQLNSERNNTSDPPKAKHVSLPQSDDIEETISLVDATTNTLLTMLDCPGLEWHFCAMIEMTAPYRAVNIEEALGLNIDVKDRYLPQQPGSELKLTVDLPDFPSYLHVVYARRDGKIDHILSSRSPLPAGLTQQLELSRYRIPDAPGLALIMALAAEDPLFPPGQLSEVDATLFLDRLQEEFARVVPTVPPRRTAVSQLLINVE